LETIVSPQMTTGYPSTGISNINKLLGFRKHSPAAHTRCHTMQCKSIPDRLYASPSTEGTVASTP
jgi:hypothetical protein